jgi:ATP-dependent protease Clp ATPase subunit
VSRTGVQRNLLKLLEETDVDLKSPFDLASQMERMFEVQRTGKAGRTKVNTRNILFIVSGAFYGLEEIILKRLKRHDIGFHSPRREDDSVDRTDILKLVKAEDLIEYGFESEFIGRLPVTSVLHNLNEQDLYDILCNDNCTIVNSKKRDFEAYGITVEFDDEALRMFARIASGEHTGARGLISALERVLMKFEMKLPSTNIREFRVTTQVVEDPQAELVRILFEDATQGFREAFQREHGIHLNFSREALDEIRKKTAESGIRADFLCEGLLKDFGLGLKLINVKEFTIEKDMVNNPKDYLEKLIQEHYRNQQ